MPLEAKITSYDLWRLLLRSLWNLQALSNDHLNLPRNIPCHCDGEMVSLMFPNAHTHTQTRIHVRTLFVYNNKYKPKYECESGPWWHKWMTLQMCASVFLSTIYEFHYYYVSVCVWVVYYLLIFSALPDHNWILNKPIRCILVRWFCSLAGWLVGWFCCSCCMFVNAVVHLSFFVCWRSHTLAHTCSRFSHLARMTNPFSHLIDIYI